MKEFIRGLLTGKDNRSWDLFRVMYVVSLAIFYIYEYFEIHRSGVFNEMEFAEAIGLITVGFGGALFVKKDSEPS